jgi:NADPH2:quinone reductase
MLVKAIVVEETGGPERLVLREVAEPEPGAGEAVVEVRAAAVNFADALIRQGRYPQMPELPFVPGSEVAGETADGRRVVGFVRRSGGGYAERAVVEEQWLFDLPEGASFEEGAAFLLAFLTAWLPLTRQANVRPGTRVLVHAAAGGVGSAAVQVARLLGAEVVATAGSAEKLALPRSLGAAETLTYEGIGELEPVDVVFDPVGGELFAASLKLLRPDASRCLRPRTGRGRTAARRSPRPRAATRAGYAPCAATTARAPAPPARRLPGQCGRRARRSGRARRGSRRS